jgi:hypothetical protein
MSESIILRTTLSQLVAAYRQSDLEIRQAFSSILVAQERLKTDFGRDHSFDIARQMETRHLDFDQPDKLIAEIKKDAWRALIDRMELRRILSIAASNKLDEQLQTGEGLPDIEEGAIFAMLDGTLARAHEFIEEAVKEVFEYLRPHHSQYKTNSELEIGSRVILGWAVQQEYHSAKFRVNHHRDDQIRAVDNVFHALDGKGSVKSTRGPLIDAILASPEGRGETVYFKFKCFGNGNLHLEFKRHDLVTKLNQVAGGQRLRPPSDNPEPPTTEEPPDVLETAPSTLALL